VRIEEVAASMGMPGRGLTLGEEFEVLAANVIELIHERHGATPTTNPKTFVRALTMTCLPQLGGREEPGRS